MSDRPKLGSLEERAAPDLVAADGKRIRGRIPYGIESVDMGGWREIIEPGALDSTSFDDLVVTVDHGGVPLGRYPGTLELEDRADGLHWAVDPPESRSDIREAVERGDLRAGSWRMVVGRDEWRGQVRHVHEITELKDVAVATRPAYRDAVVEYRSTDPAEGQEDPMSEHALPASEPDTDTDEDRPQPPAGGLQVEDRVTASEPARRGLADEFRTRGFPGETATIPWDEFEDRAVTWTGSVDNINKLRSQAGPFGADERYVARVRPGRRRRRGHVGRRDDPDRPLARHRRERGPRHRRRHRQARNRVHAHDRHDRLEAGRDYPDEHPERLSRAAGVQHHDRERPAARDQRRARQADPRRGRHLRVPGTRHRRAARLDPQSDDHDPGVRLQPGHAAAAAGQHGSARHPASHGHGGRAVLRVRPGPAGARNIFGLAVRVSKTVPAPTVVDSTALGKLYASPVTLARFEADAGTTNRSNVRMELNAVFGVERTAAAIRIAAA